MDGFYVTTDKTKLDLDKIFDFLSNRSYWAKGRSREVFDCSINNSLCFSVFDSQATKLALQEW